MELVTCIMFIYYLSTYYFEGCVEYVKVTCTMYKLMTGRTLILAKVTDNDPKDNVLITFSESVEFDELLESVPS